VAGERWLIFTSTSAMIACLSTEIREPCRPLSFRAVISVVLLLLHDRRRRSEAVALQAAVVGHCLAHGNGDQLDVAGFLCRVDAALAPTPRPSLSRSPCFSVVVAALIVGEKVRWRRWSATVSALPVCCHGAGRGERAACQLGALVALANAAAVAVRSCW